jgi:hypothetical protein
VSRIGGGRRFRGEFSQSDLKMLPPCYHPRGVRPKKGAYPGGPRPFVNLPPLDAFHLTGAMWQVEHTLGKYIVARDRSGQRSVIDDEPNHKSIILRRARMLPV